MSRFRPSAPDTVCSTNSCSVATILCAGITGGFIDREGTAASLGLGAAERARATVAARKVCPGSGVTREGPGRGEAPMVPRAPSPPRCFGTAAVPTPVTKGGAFGFAGCNTGATHSNTISRGPVPPVSRSNCTTPSRLAPPHSCPAMHTMPSPAFTCVRAVNNKNQKGT